MKLKDLAARLGLSPTTVSRALNGYPEVSEATRRRVVDAAQRFNYRPSTRALSLATGRAMAIGHVIPVSSQHEMVNPVFADFVAGAGEAYARAGYDMMLSVVNDAEEVDAYRDIAAKRSVDGVIVHGPRVDDTRMDLLTELGIPFVVHGRGAEEEVDYPWLDVNNRRAFRRATEFLIDLGHRRIALVNGLESMTFAARRRRGYEEGLEARGIDVDPALMRSGEMTEPYGYRSVRDMLRLDDPPTAILVASLIPAIGARRALGELGIELGRGASIVAHDDELSYLANEGDVPMFTATRSSVRAAGRRCAEILIERIRDPGVAPRHELLEAELVVGASTGPAP